MSVNRNVTVPAGCGPSISAQYRASFLTSGP
jgi:hypothetical protein